jgi:hypothetical protein
MSNDAGDQMPGESVRIANMSAHPQEGGVDALQLVVALSPAPSPDEHWWRRAEVSRRLKIVGSGSSKSAFTIHIEVPEDQLEAVAREVRDAVSEAGIAYPQRYVSDLQARDERVAAEKLQQRQRQEARQAVLDRVMSG